MLIFQVHDKVTGSSASLQVRSEVSQDAIKEIAAFEKFIDTYFQNCDNNNTLTEAPNADTDKAAAVGNGKPKMSSTALLELSI